MKAENLRWVFNESFGVSFFLADANNVPLGYPLLKALTKEEIKRLTDLGIHCWGESESSYYTGVLPQTPREQLEITAPVYIQTRSDRKIVYKRAGEYTDKWTDPRDIQFVNEIILHNIPQFKVHIPGNYVSISE